MNPRADLPIVRKLFDLLSGSEKRNATVLFGLMCIGVLLETLSVGLVLPLAALLTQHDLALKYPKLQPFIEELGNPSREDMLLGGMLALVGVYVVKVVFLGFLAWRETRFTFDLQAQLSQRLFALYLRQPYTFHLRRNSASLIRNVVHEASIFANSAVLPGILLITESLVLLCLCGLLLFIEPVGVMVVAGTLGIAAWVIHYLTRKRIKRWGETRLYHEGLRIQHVQQGLGGAKEIKLLGREEECFEQFETHNIQAARVNERKQLLHRLPRLGLELLAVSGLAILVTSMLAQHYGVEDVLPTLGLFAAVAFRVVPSITRILNAVQSVRYSYAVIDTLHEELRLGMPEVAGVPFRNVQPFLRTVMLHHLWYSYPGATAPVLQDISLTIHRGESVGIIGSSGAGKSTLVDVVLGLLAPTKGHILVDGADIQRDLRHWQDQIGYVPQSIFLTDDTLRRNVAFGLPEELIDNAAVSRAIRAAQLEEFIGTLPEGVETIVGERGVRLSGGQRQRVGIARALYHDPAVLVLDEATSSLDSDIERGVMQAVYALRGTKTIIIVAHRISTVEQCDRLYRLDHGAIVAQGSPDSVLGKTPLALHQPQG